MKTIKSVLALGALLAAAAPALAASPSPVSSGDYDNLWIAPHAQAQTVVQEGRSSLTEPLRAVTGEEIQHHQAPIYAFIHQQQ
jgi:hypothetical protein